MKKGPRHCPFLPLRCSVTRRITVRLTLSRTDTPFSDPMDVVFSWVPRFSHPKSRNRLLRRFGVGWYRIATRRAIQNYRENDLTAMKPLASGQIYCSSFVNRRLDNGVVSLVLVHRLILASDIHLLPEDINSVF